VKPFFFKHITVPPQFDFYPKENYVKKFRTGKITYPMQ